MLSFVSWDNMHDLLRHCEAADHASVSENMKFVTYVLVSPVRYSIIVDIRDFTEYFVVLIYVGVFC